MCDKMKSTKIKFLQCWIVYRNTGEQRKKEGFSLCMPNLICCVNQPSRLFSALLPDTASKARCWNTAVTLQFPLTYCILVLEVWLQVSPAQTAIHQPCSICTGSQFNDPQGVARTHLWISLPESNYSSRPGVPPPAGLQPILSLCVGIDVCGGGEKPISWT